MRLCVCVSNVRLSSRFGAKRQWEVCSALWRTQEKAARCKEDLLYVETRIEFLRVQPIELNILQKILTVSEKIKFIKNVLNAV